MRPFIISVDTTSDLPDEYMKEHGLQIHPLHYLIDDKEYGKEMGELSPHDFYQIMKDGKMPTTNATNIDYDIRLFEQAVEEGYDIIHLPFSSAMSASCSNAILAANQVIERHPEARISVMDSLTATSGLGVLVRKAVAMKENGKTFDEVENWIKEVSPNMICHFTLPDLFHMWRGGRLKKSTAIIGTALKIQPILHVDAKGGLSPIKKVRGRQAAINGLADGLEPLMAKNKLPDMVCITHGDCLEEAKLVGKRVEEKYGIHEIYYSYLSPTLGAHSGPDTLTIGYIGDNR